MLKPSDVNFTATSALDTRAMKVIEDQFDRAIRASEASGVWPARVDHQRDGASPAEVEAVAEQFRAVGWKVDTHDRSHRASLSASPMPRHDAPST